jgi:hypothetical protein
LVSVKVFAIFFDSFKKKNTLSKNTAKPEGLDLDCGLAWLTFAWQVLRFVVGRGVGAGQPAAI